MEKYSCRGIYKGKAEGEVLVSTDAVCFYLCDPKTGVMIEKGHAIEKKSVAGKILLVKSGKGSSVVMVDGLYQLKQHGNLPKAIIVDEIEPVLVSCAVVVGVPIVDRLERPYEILKDGMTVEVNSDEGYVAIKR